MSKREAVATGYFDTDVKREDCAGTAPLRWKDDYRRTFDPLTDQNGSIASIGVLRAGPTTLWGLQVGSSYAAVRKVLGANNIKRADDYGQAGLILNDGDAWIGFSFDAAAQKVTDASKVAFIEVSRGRQPGLLGDGC